MALTCELCGGNDLVKQGDFFVCQTCGAKYSPEDARKMMGAPGAPGAAAPAGSGNAAQIENYLRLARSAYDSSNNSEAENYANRIIEIDPENAEAWLIKGRAAGWQSTLARIRISESVECWKKCAKYASREEEEKFGKIISEELTNLFRAIIKLRADNFAKYPSDDNLKALLGSASEFFQLNVGLLTESISFALQNKNNTGKAWPKVDTTVLQQFLAEQINTAAVTASDAADKAYGPDRSDQNEYAYKTWLDKSDNCLGALKFAVSQAQRESTLDTIEKNFRAIMVNTITSCCYRYQVSEWSSGYVQDKSLTESAKAARRQEMDELSSTVKEQKEKIKKERVEQYWKTHAKEKKELEEKKTKLGEEKDALNVELKELQKEKNKQVTEPKAAIEKECSVPVEAEAKLNEITENIKQLQTELRSLGLFKGKEKKALQERIDALVTEQAAAKELVEKQQAERKRKRLQAYSEIDTKWAQSDSGRREKEITTRLKEIEAEIQKIESKLNSPVA